MRRILALLTIAVLLSAHAVSQNLVIEIQPESDEYLGGTIELKNLIFTGTILIPSDTGKLCHEKVDRYHQNHF